MDQGHYNCRDYHISPHFAPTTLINNKGGEGGVSDGGGKHIRSPFYRSPFSRHESFEQLEQRSRSPASFKLKFPLLQLPLELRQHIFALLLPRTIEQPGLTSPANLVRNFSAVKKQRAQNVSVSKPVNLAQKIPSNVVWQRGNVTLLRVCRQMHNECADMLYGNNTFLLFITYSGITFQYSWLLPSGLAPKRRFSFLELMPPKYMSRIKRLVINVDYVDSYTSMIKFNVSGKGLTHGLRKQSQLLANALLSAAFETQEPSDSKDNDEKLCSNEERRLARIAIRVSNGNAFLDQVKSEVVRQREGPTKIVEDIHEMLEPFADLRGVREVAVSGAVTDDFARNLEQKMKSPHLAGHASALTRTMRDPDLIPPQHLCVYGNDL